ncbi:MAG: hypothetical protein J5854_04180 [Clostridia bacterium]|nr:hypothetical protein [Clostridia bacterium]
MNAPDKKTRATLLVIAGSLLLAAIIWLVVLESTSYTRKVCRMINEFGYHIAPNDLYTKGYGDSTSIEKLLGGGLDEVVSQSKACGFPADIEKVGRVELMLWNMDDEKVMVIWLTDRAPQLVFIENSSTGETWPIGDN